MAKILVVDDEIGIRELLREILCDEGYDVALAEDASAARNARQAFQPDLVLLDIWMPDTDGITLLKEWAASGQLATTPVIMMSGHGSIDTAVEAVKFGALDFLEKPIALQKLLATVKRGLQRLPAKAKAPQLSLASFTRSAALRDLRKRLEQISQKSRILLLRSAPGSLAELCARSLQGSGGWLDLALHNQPIEVQILEDLRGGVLFIEELQRLGRTQQKNLAFAAERVDKYELRLVVATASSEQALLSEGWDTALVSRLFELTLVPPSLPELREDVPEIVTQLLLHFSESGETPPRRLGNAALNALRNSTWGGGFGELKAAVRSLALGALEDEISAEEVIRFITRGSSAALALPLDLPLREARETFERLYFEHHLQLEDGNITRLAEKTGLERTHLYRKLKQLGIQVGRRNSDT